MIAATPAHIGHTDHLLIIGAGLAGYHTARNARINGHIGPITVMGAESEPAYDRPALSKTFLTGAIGVEDLRLDDTENPLDVTWFRGANVTGISASPLGAHTADGVFHSAEAIVIVTGAEACTLPRITRLAQTGEHREAVSTPGYGPADHHIPVHHRMVMKNSQQAVGSAFVLRTIDDAVALRDADLKGASVAVVGGGFLALEAAATCTARGAVDVTVIAGEDYPGARRMGEPVGQAVRALHERHGVRFGPCAKAEALVEPSDIPTEKSHSGNHQGYAHRVVLSNGTAVDADIVICAIGAVPATAWLTDATGPRLTMDASSGAILCNDWGFTGVPGIWAAGDCAQWTSQSAGLRPTGHWQEAMEQAAVVAAAVTGAVPAPLQEPYFWSEQYNVTIQAAGRLNLADEIRILAGSAETSDLLVSYLQHGQDVGILGMNRFREVTRWRKQHRIRTTAALAA